MLLTYVLCISCALTCLLEPLPYSNTDIDLCTRHSFGDRRFKITDNKKHRNSLLLLGISFMKNFVKVGISRINSSQIVSQLNCLTASIESHKRELCPCDPINFISPLIFLTTPFKTCSDVTSLFVKLETAEEYVFLAYFLINVFLSRCLYFIVLCSRWIRNRDLKSKIITLHP